MNDLVGRSCGGKLVDIHGWCIMGNHYHLILSEVAEGGITKFLMKLNVGYAKYFNAKYKRTGVLFQGRTKKVHIKRDAQFLYIVHYVHMNPLDFLAGERKWREEGVHSHAKALRHLKSYRWSSYLDYCNEKNFPSVLTKDIFAAVFPNYQKELASFMHSVDVQAGGEDLE